MVTVILEQVLKTLLIMHEKGVVYGLMKPCSIWVDFVADTEPRAIIAEYDLDKDLVMY